MVLHVRALDANHPARALKVCRPCRREHSLGSSSQQRPFWLQAIHAGGHLSTPLLSSFIIAPGCRTSTNICSVLGVLLAGATPRTTTGRMPTTWGRPGPVARAPSTHRGGGTERAGAARGPTMGVPGAAGPPQVGKPGCTEGEGLCVDSLAGPPGNLVGEPTSPVSRRAQDWFRPSDWGCAAVYSGPMRMTVPLS